MNEIKGIYEKILSEYADLIFITQYQNPNYEKIHFDQFLKRRFEHNELFHRDKHIKRAIDAALEGLFGNPFDKQEVFTQQGKAGAVPFPGLKYYQPGVGINGSQAGIHSPVFVVQYKNELILYDGYHRALQKIMNNEQVIDALVLSL